MARHHITLIMSILLASTLYFIIPQSHEIKLGLALLALTGSLWVTESFHVSITALLIPLLCIVSGIYDVKQALSQFANPIIFLFLGGFALAAAMREQQLDQRVASLVLGCAKGHLGHACLLLFGTTAVLSMWISNTATTAMMLPLALGMLSHIRYDEQPKTYWFVLLGIAYSANIGGIGTLVGSPPNAIAAAAANISFVDWMKIGLPAVMLMLPLALLVLKFSLKPNLNYKISLGETLEPMNRQQWLTLSVFLLTVLGWLFSKQLSTMLAISKGFDAVVAISAVILLCGLRLTTWSRIQGGTDWGVLMLFGGGLTLSAMLKTTGASLYLAQSIHHLLVNAPLILFLFAVLIFVVLLTEVTSNTASSALLVPVFISIASSMDLSPSLMAALIAIAASCAFMLPVATPPNAIVFGSGYLQQKTMMRAGMLTHGCIISLLTLAGWLVL